MLRIACFLLSGFLAGSVHALHFSHPNFSQESPRWIEVNYRSNEPLPIEWQMSLDGGGRWRPMKETLGQVSNFRHPSESGLSVTRLTSPGEFPAGLQFRLKHGNGPSAVLSHSYTIPFVSDFPDEEREFTIPKYEGSGIERVRFGRGLVSFVYFEDDRIRIRTAEKTRLGWNLNPDLLVERKVSGYEGVQVFGKELFVAVQDGSGKHAGILVYRWEGFGDGWVFQQELWTTVSRGTQMKATEDRFFLALGESQRAAELKLYEKNSSGDWEFSSQLVPDTALDGVGGRVEIFPFESRVVGFLRNPHGASNQLFVYEKTETGWHYLGSRGVASGRAFASTDRIALIEYHDSGWQEGGPWTTVRILNPFLPFEEMERDSVSFSNGYYPVGVVRDWLVYFIESTPDMLIPYSVLALSPIHEDRLYPEPALTAPHHYLDYSQIGEAIGADLNKVNVVSTLNDGTRVVDSFDILNLKVPDYPKVDSPKWVLPRAPDDGSDRVSLIFRDAANEELTNIQISLDNENWIPVNESLVERIVLNDDIDGDGNTVLVEARISIGNGSEPVFFRLEENVQRPGTGQDP